MEFKGLRDRQTRQADLVKPAYAERCMKGLFLACKAVTLQGGLDESQLISEIKNKLEADCGAFRGAGETQEYLLDFAEGKPLGPLAIVLDEELGLHHGWFGGDWDPTAFNGEYYVEYGKRTKYGHLILAGKIENFANVWSSVSFEEVAGVESGRLFAYIEHPADNDKFGRTQGKGYIVHVDVQSIAVSGCPTVNDGYGYLIYGNGDYYEGEISGGVRHGQGKLTSKGSVYEGGWQDNEQHGQGKVTLANGHVYEGLWEEGELAEGQSPTKRLSLASTTSGISVTSDAALLDEDDKEEV